MPKEKPKKWFHVTAEYIFDADDLKTALKWARNKKYTYERDGEIGGLMMCAYQHGVVDLGVEEEVSDHPIEEEAHNARYYQNH